MILVTTDDSESIVSLYGGQVLSYQPVSQQHDLLFVSKNAFYETGKAIKGGTPICWPWFGENPENKMLPFHGFVRNQLWEVKAVDRSDSYVKIVLRICDRTETLSIWPHQFVLEQTITIGDTLRIELKTKNTGKNNFTLTQAIHTYFKVGDISQVILEGLENKSYLDKTEQFNEKLQTGMVCIDKETDRIYLDVQYPLHVKDSSLNRTIQINSTGSNTAVVWNPWKEICMASADLQEDEYHSFICVETANTANEFYVLSPGEQHCLIAEYRIVPY